MKSRVNNIHFSFSYTKHLLTFSDKKMNLRMVMSNSLFPPSSILLDPDNPCSIPPESMYYDEVNSSTWIKYNISEKYPKPNHCLVPICHIIDGININKQCVMCSV